MLFFICPVKTINTESFLFGQPVFQSYKLPMEHSKLIQGMGISCWHFSSTNFSRSADDMRVSWHWDTPWTELVWMLYCAITALDGYPSNSDNIHYIGRRPLYMGLPPSTGPWSSLPSPTLLTSTFASSRHLLMPEPSHLSHVISSFVTGMTIMSARQRSLTLCSITSETSCGMWWKPRQWRF